MQTISLENNLKPIKYAWPGGYPVFYVARTGYKNDSGGLELSKYDREEFVCCPDCAGKAAEKEIILTNSDCNWEDPDMICEVCNKRIESAYAEEFVGMVEGGEKLEE